MGGLGNQMFQYAVARSLQLSSGVDSDLRVFFEDGYRLAVRSYALDVFSTTATVATPEELKTIGPERRIRRRIKLALKQPIDKNVVREKKYFVYDPTVLDRKTDTYLIGFWQSFRYFENIRRDVLNDFTLKAESQNMQSARKVIGNSARSVSLHIRRGDYLQKASGFAPLKLDHYKKTLQLLKEKLSYFDVFVFTDDVKWAQKHLVDVIAPQSMTMISNPYLEDSEELILMSSCHHHIIANSSFSWWGAWLNDKPGKMVIAPRSWNGLDESIPTSDLIPEQWIQV